MSTISRQPVKVSGEPKEYHNGLRTFGAKLIIFPHPFIRRSALTTPPIRVPSISRLLFRRTAALSSNRIIRPSGRLTAFRVRTMTARRTSPRRTLMALPTWVAATGRARFTTQTISSPTDPQPLLTFCLRTFTHSTRSAPELSMTWARRQGVMFSRKRQNFFCLR